MLNVSDSAVKKFKDFINEQNLAGHGIRILAVPGG
jgi:Fe-S cluster assembly iron-binding protein IscA